MLDYITPDEAVRAVKSGDHIHISRAAQLPYCLLEALERRADAGITDSHFHHSYSDRLHYVMTTNLTAKTKLRH